MKAMQSDQRLADLMVYLRVHKMVVQMVCHWVSTTVYRSEMGSVVH